MEQIAQIKSRMDALELKIKWANFSRKAPAQFITAEIQSRRRKVLIALLKEYNAIACRFLTLKKEHKSTHHALNLIGAKYECINGTFHIVS